MHTAVLHREKSSTRNILRRARLSKAKDNTVEIRGRMGYTTLLYFSATYMTAEW
jgi:hypothetical protein